MARHNEASTQRAPPFQPLFNGNRCGTKRSKCRRQSEQEWFRVRVGQGITSHTTPDGVMPVMQGTGENGKSVLTTTASCLNQVTMHIWRARSCSSSQRLRDSEERAHSGANDC
jgi:hypothetical protein